jgi:Transposase DNA-binding/Transposase DDE domain
MFVDIGREFRRASLGDRRRSARLEAIGTRLATDPSRSFPEAMASEGQLEALYRFLNNDGVSFGRILRPHAVMTAERCAEHRDVLVLHDTTSMEFVGEREGLGRLETSARTGFFLHVGLAVTAARQPLGVLAAETWVRRAPPRGRNKRQLRKDPKRESLRWERGVVAAEANLGGALSAVHVMDREGDNYDLFSYLQQDSIRHIVRLAHNRNLVGVAEKLKEHALAARCVFRCEVDISRRKQARVLDQKSIHPERDARTASLAVSATTVELRRSNNHSPNVPPSLQVNIVTVQETSCPKGLEPIRWFLVTTEPVRTRAQLEFIVNAYRTRWMVEEFFKALKTGCRFEKRQLESFKSLENALAIFLPLAVRLLALRGAARAAPSRPCSALTAQQIEILRHHTTRFMSPDPSNEEATMALAEFGGHLRSNGPPGWSVLGRALERLLLIEVGWNQRGEAIDD